MISTASLQHSHFQASKLLINVPLQGSRIPLENFEVLARRSNFIILGSWLLGPTYGILGPEFRVLGPAFFCMPIRIRFLKNYAIVMIMSLFNKVVDLQRVTSLKKRLQCRSFRVSFNKYLRMHFFYRTPAFSSFILYLFWLQKQPFANVLQNSYS